jgi:hypothetical protein
MINLLPPESRQSILYARRNRHLLHWASVLLLAIVAILVVVILGQLYISRSVASYTKQVEQSRQQLKIQKLEETQARVEDISSSVKLAVQVLSREVLFSKLIRQVGAAMPENTVLTNLQITKVQGGVDLNASSVDYNTATQIQVNLQDPANKIFEKADIVNITCHTPTASTNTTTTTNLRAKYPCEVTIRALFSKNNPFLFINDDSQAGDRQ